MSLFLDVIYSLTLLPHYGYHRLRTGKYGPDVVEKLGILPADLASKEANAPVIWLHAVSVGEVFASRPLVKALQEAFPGVRVCMSTTTATGREVAQKNFGAANVFYFPLDCSWMVKRAFSHLQPSLVILMELEVWPHFLAEAEAQDIPVVVSNVRITRRSADNFKRFAFFATPMLKRVSLWLSQDDSYAAILRDLGVLKERVKTVGSIKYDGLDFSDNPDALNVMRTELGGGRLFVAGSTHVGEDELVYQAFLMIRDSCGADIRLVLVPRHPERCDAVEAAAPSGMKVWRRSLGQAPAETDIILGDTMGELSDIYRAADAVFIGGTFLPSVGGHNMLEPAAFARPIVYGPEVHNFIEPAAVLEADHGAVRLKECTASALAEAVIQLLANPEQAAAMGERAREAARSMQGAVAKTIEALSAYSGVLSD